MDASGITWPSLQALPEFHAFIALAKQEFKTRPRQVLSHHTSTPCQPRKAPGLVASLGSCGLEQHYSELAPGSAVLTVKFPNSDERGDDLYVHFESAPFNSHSKSEFKRQQSDACHDACFTIWIYLMAQLPLLVRIAPGSVRHGEISVRALRRGARFLHVAAMIDAASRTSIVLAPGGDSSAQPQAFLPASGGDSSIAWLSIGSTHSASAHSSGQQEEEPQALPSGLAVGLWVNLAAFNMIERLNLQALLPAIGSNMQPQAQAQASLPASGGDNSSFKKHQRL